MFPGYRTGPIAVLVDSILDSPTELSPANRGGHGPGAHRLVHAAVSRSFNCRPCCPALGKSTTDDDDPSSGWWRRPRGPLGRNAQVGTRKGAGRAVGHAGQALSNCGDQQGISPAALRRECPLTELNCPRHLQIWPRRERLGEQLADYGAANIGQTKITPLVPECEFGMVQAQAVQDRCL